MDKSVFETHHVDKDLQLSPEVDGIGALEPCCGFERVFNKFANMLLFGSSALLLLCTLFISIDIVGRVCFNKPWHGITDLEMLMMSAAGFLAIQVPIIRRQHLQINIFFDMFTGRTRRSVYLFTCLLSFIICIILGIFAIEAAMTWTRLTYVLEILEWPSILITGVCLFLSGVAYIFQLIHVLRSQISYKEYLGILIPILGVILLFSAPFIYRAIGIKLSSITLGGIIFVVLMGIMLLKAPLGFIMSLMGLLGLFCILRNPQAALYAVGHVPFTETATFMMIAIPMFMLMGEMVTLSGLSQDLFSTTSKWFGHYRGGLAIATVFGCAGFGAVCGESFATVMAMTAVALPYMEKHKYDYKISMGALAGGGTLGILIPPSLGFIVYAMITEQSVGKLFIAGIIPGILLATVFSCLIYFQVRREPSLAPCAEPCPLSEKIASLRTVIPVIILFAIVVFGILNGLFTPAEGGAAGTVMALLYALARRKLTWKSFSKTMEDSSIMFGKVFILFTGLYVLSIFLAGSRLPMLLADTVAAMDVNKYVVLAAVTVLYIILGCLMSILPMMILTLPTIFPTISALGFDPIWFGTYCVILMEMGVITPPVGLNIFTLAGLRPKVPMLFIFKAAAPYFFCMLFVLVLITIFPQIVLCLVPGY